MLSIYLTTHCNLRCFICRRENHKGENVNFENLFKLTNAIRSAETVELTGWGECFVYPKFEDAINFICSINGNKNLIQITTNGTLLSKKYAEILNPQLKLLTISLNAATKDTYNRDMVNGDFDKTLLAIREFMDNLKEENIKKMKLHFVAHKNNFTEIPRFVNLASNLGIKTVSVGHYIVSQEHLSYSLLNIREEYNKQISLANELAAKLGINLLARRFFEEKGLALTSLDACRDPFNSCYVGINGDISPCCYSGSYYMGNVYTEGFENVWFNSNYKNLRKSRNLKVCNMCTPYIPMDNPEAHISSFVKEKEKI